MTLLGLLLLAGGFAAFLSGLVMDARPVTETPAGESTNLAFDGSTMTFPESFENEPSQVQSAPQTVGETHSPVEVAATEMADVSTTPTVDADTSTTPTVDADTSTTPTVDADTSTTPVVGVPPVMSVATQEVTESSPLRNMTCARCTREIADGQMAAECPVCGSAHHAACWIDNRFHCSTPGCAGHGNLVAPEEAGHADHL
jgi:hypothetical protein